ncbi:MAG TPA: TetR/AcrR family transcriptional regulator [Candidatus Acidoferrales bacterium]|nr:TetR/AcrR family transcriptional regulator [Candidatus Acidoferrales bacterium]
MTMVTEAKGSRRDRKQAALRARIVSTAMDLFSRHGIANVTVDHIADVADIGKGTIYNYFQAKEDILVAYMVDIERKVQVKVPDFEASKKPLAWILMEFLRFQFRLKKPYHNFVRVFLAQMFVRTAETLPYMMEMQKVIDPPIEHLFRGLQARKMIRGDLEIPSLIAAFKTLHLGLTAVWAIEGPPFRGTRQILRQEVQLFCEGITRKNS